MIAPTPTVANIPPKIPAGTTSRGVDYGQQPTPASVPMPDIQSSKDESSVKSTDAPNTESKLQTQQERNGMEEILMQMFPDADKDFVKGALGKNPSLEDVRNLAESMAQLGYPGSKDKGDDAASVGTTSTSATSPGDKDKKKRGGLRSKLGKAFGGLRGSNFGGASGPRIPGAH